DWAFVVAPTNRRRFGFDWQDWGRLDAIEILDLVMEEYPIDPDRVYLIGHSMGGHGAWHIGTTHADRFAAIVPSAGWASFQLYMPWFLRADELYADPNLTRIFEQCTNPDRTERLLPNLRNVPVLAVHGGDDDNVPPTHARLLIGTLERMGYDARLWEESGQGHWWDAHPGIPGSDCVDGLRIRSFCHERVRDPAPRHVTFVSYDIGNNNSSYWIKVSEDINPIGRVYVDAEITNDGKLSITTENVRSLFYDHPDGAPFDYPDEININGDVLDIEFFTDSVRIFLELTSDGWKTGMNGHRLKTAYFRGPIKRAYFKPFTIVAGQSGNPEQNELNMEIARNLSQRWWYRANGTAMIYTDIELPDWVLETESNLILIGGPDSNTMSAEYADRFPFQMEDDGIWFGDEWVSGEDLACQFVYPIRNPNYSPVPLIHCIWGNSLEGMRLSGGLTCLYSGSNLPDFLIYDNDVRLMGYAGVRAAGFFDNGWELDPDYYYIRK
ncbi:prolyl oligopeptidase family serine peptidase, partial [bacterium]|nr:prolyl oligopeptidase family serine peptidase [bacterium]